MAGVIAIQRAFARRLGANFSRRLVSTSKKSNSDTVATTAAEVSKEAVIPGTRSRKEWISYGFDTKSKEADRNAMHSLMFVSVTLCIVVGGFYMAYLPDYNRRDWATREAFLELKRREDAGLPHIDPNYINPSKIELPSDEELGDTEIII